MHRLTAVLGHGAGGCATAQEPRLPAHPVRGVDPFIGTAARATPSPAPVSPFGMVQLSPDTDYRPFRQSL